ncbi:MAG: thioredoxin domain-containing protein [Patescibacteria group bacterium]|jgi:protein-disulfide isomerase
MFSKETKFILALVLILFLVFSYWLIVYSPKEAPTPVVYETGRPDRGAPDAKTVVTLYFDFGCSLCHEASFALDKIYQQYGNAVLVKYRYVPLTANSIMVEAAAECAQRQGKFFAYRDYLFASSDTVWTAEKLKAGAAASGLNQPQFDGCLDNKETEAVVEYDAGQAWKLGVTATPALFLNGQAVELNSLETAVARSMAAGQ